MVSVPTASLFLTALVLPGLSACSSYAPVTQVPAQPIPSAPAVPEAAKTARKIITRLEDVKIDSRRVSIWVRDLIHGNEHTSDQAAEVLRRMGEKARRYIIKHLVWLVDQPAEKLLQHAAINTATLLEPHDAEGRLGLRLMLISRTWIFRFWAAVCVQELGGVGS